MRDTAWFHRKADAYAAGWKAHFGVYPSISNITLGLAVAIHETNAGDVKGWEGEHNWGAVQHRVPNTAELAVIKAAGLTPSLANVEPARAAIDTAVNKGELAYPEDCALHVDSSPGKGFYWVFFWAFDTDAGGAALFVKIIAVNRPSCRAVLEGNGTALALAQAMYSSRYFEGFRLPGSWYAQVAGKWTVVDEGTEGAITGKALNALDYGGALAKLQPEILAALKDWSPSDVVTSAPPSDEELEHASRLIKLSDVAMAGTDVGMDALKRILGEPRD